MCTVTCDVPNSRSIAASTASAKRCASSTGVAPGTAMVTSAKSWPEAVDLDRTLVNQDGDRLAQDLDPAPRDDQRDRDRQRGIEPRSAHGREHERSHRHE